MQNLAKYGGFALGVSLLFGSPATASPFFFSTGNPDGLVATASQPSSSGKTEIESADDFVLTTETKITSATFTGLLTGISPAIVGVRVEIYKVFPHDSTFPPSGNVPTRTNSPSDNALVELSAPADFTFGTTLLSSSFTAANSVLNGINASPSQHTGGEGPVTGQEEQFNITFTTPLDLSAGHYFFVPQVELAGANDQFFWLSAPRPIVPPGTVFPVGFTDLQEWIRNAALDPDWLRVGSDIIGTPATGPTFNATFSLTGRVPEPLTLSLFGAGVAGLAVLRRRKKNHA